MKRVYKRVSSIKQSKFIDNLVKLENLGALNWFYIYKYKLCNYYIATKYGKQKVAYYYFDGTKDPNTKEGFAAYILKELL